MLKLGEKGCLRSYINAADRVILQPLVLRVLGSVGSGSYLLHRHGLLKISHPLRPEVSAVGAAEDAGPLEHADKKEPFCKETRENFQLI